jgi:DinB superfamily
LLRQLDRQLAAAWGLLELHLTGISDAEMLWRPAPVGMHVHDNGDGQWVADWPDREDYSIGPPSIAWVTWHIGFWWSMVLNHSFGDATLQRVDVMWPGSAETARAWLNGLHDSWVSRLDELGDDELEATTRTRWPMRDRPFADVVGWANGELMKNAAEIGFARFLYAASHPAR